MAVDETAIQSLDESRREEIRRRAGVILHRRIGPPTLFEPTLKVRGDVSALDFLSRDDDETRQEPSP